MKPIDRPGVRASLAAVETYHKDVTLILASDERPPLPGGTEQLWEAARAAEDLSGHARRLAANLAEAIREVERETQVLPHERAEMRSFTEQELDRAVEPHVDNEGHGVYG